LLDLQGRREIVDHLVRRETLVTADLKDLPDLRVSAELWVLKDSLVAKELLEVLEQLDGLVHLEQLDIPEILEILDRQGKLECSVNEVFRVHLVHLDLLAILDTQVSLTCLYGATQ